jgi:hypothetical protein
MALWTVVVVGVVVVVVVVGDRQWSWNEAGCYVHAPVLTAQISTSTSANMDGTTVEDAALWEMLAEELRSMTDEELEEQSGQL